MTHSLADYHRALDTFLDDLRPLEEDLVAVLLFGSLARGDVRPGKSDLLDAYVVLRSETASERTRYLNVLQVLVTAGIHLQQTGLPTHPFFYCFEHELDRSPALWLSLWRSNETSTVIRGDDVRSCLTSCAESRAVARMSIFQMRQIAHQLSRYLYEDSLSEEVCAEIVEELTTLKKFFPIMACLVLDKWITESQGKAELERTIAGVGADVLTRIVGFRDCTPACSDLEAWRTIIADLLQLVEQVHLSLLDNILYERSPVFLSVFQAV